MLKTLAQLYFFRSVFHMINKIILFLIILFTAILSQNLLASPNTLNLQARIIAPSGHPLELPSVNFKLKYTDVTGTCVLYQEDFIGINMSASNGLVSLSMGSGIRTFPVAPTTLYDIFNYGSPLSCISVGTTGTTGTPIAPVNPTLLDRRRLILEFNDGSGWQGIPSMSLNSVPYALHSRLAYNASQLGGVAAANYVKFSDMTSAGCVAGQALRYDGTNFVCETTGGGGGGTVTSVSGAGPISVATGTTTPVISIATANSTTTGALSSSDFTLFNSKQAAGNYITALTGDVTLSGFSAGSATATLADVTTAGTSSKVTFDAKGRITSSATPSNTLLSGERTLKLKVMFKPSNRRGFFEL
jgi:hypothetical protein